MKNSNELVGITAEDALRLRQEASKQFALADALTRLHDNPDFKLLILEDYLQNEPMRLVHMLAENCIVYGPNSEAQLRDNREQMIGVARLGSYFRNIYRIAEGAQKTIMSLEEAERTPSYQEENDNDSSY